MAFKSRYQCIITPCDTNNKIENHFEYPKDENETIVNNATYLNIN